jgi:hypothetical protein
MKLGTLPFDRRAQCGVAGAETWLPASTPDTACAIIVAAPSRRGV